MTGMGLCDRVADIIHAANADSRGMVKRLCREMPWMADFLQAEVVGPTSPKKPRGQANFLLQFLRGDAELSTEQLKEISVLVFLQDAGMCRTKADCRACALPMTIGVKDGVFVLRCSKCTGSLSMRNGTFLSGSRIDNRTFLWLFTHLCAWRNYTQASIATFTGLDKNTVSEWVTLVREVISVYLRNTPIVLGGHGEVGYADGVWIGTSQKYGRGDPNRGVKDKKGKRILLLVMAEQKSKRIQVRVIRSENKKEVHEILAQCFARGTEIQTDSAGCFLNLDKNTGADGDLMEFSGAMVNHSKGEFARWEAGHQISSNKGERMNGLLKRFLVKHNGFPLQTVMLALDEFIYHTNENDPAVCDLDKFISHIGKYSQASIDIDDAPGNSLYFS
ncbi:hypothetical protein BV898_18169 [Hypsibius exemplaris]|uniref:ISXO2-like transposase domain-containing protein n=1 Tax=Hypsibius exemplaris TaxID=2072580 RepID=A0A9X6NGW4_HYPEX|nr:hypothetical protein BV898_18169 [Hypsibius exemplaris]